MPSVLRFVFGRRAVFAAAIATAILMSAAPAIQAADDPATLAQTYEKQAAELRASAERHLAAAKVPQGRRQSTRLTIAKHCEAIAKSLQEAAAESEALAATYRQLAREK